MANSAVVIFARVVATPNRAKLSEKSFEVIKGQTVSRKSLKLTVSERRPFIWSNHIVIQVVRDEDELRKVFKLMLRTKLLANQIAAF